ncbi:xylulose kinase 2 isoform X2 [Populus alba x Populus x berolinensis]|nr:xylulose kinase 2 isoform X2 [Populus alba x Populus x berolinensis]
MMALLMQVFGIASDPQPGLEGHISPDPVDAEGYMVLLVYENGSLTQEVSAIDGKMGFYCEDRETLPPSLPGSASLRAGLGLIMISCVMKMEV